MLKYFLAIAVLAGSVYASDIRIGVGVNVGVRTPVMAETIIVERPSTLVWVPPVYERRADEFGNVYVVLVQEGYYQRVAYTPPVVYTAPYPYYRPYTNSFFGFGFSFGRGYSDHGSRGDVHGGGRGGSRH